MKHPPILRLLATLLLALTATAASAYIFYVDGIYYYVNSDGTTVSVTKEDNSRSYRGSVTIPPKVTYDGKTYSVTAIWSAAFSRCSDLTSVTIPNSVTEIGNSAFEDCTGLTSVTIPNSVTKIGYAAFQDCSGLTSVIIGNSVTEIGNQVFSGCTGLTSLTIPNSVTSIGWHAFRGCSSLTSLTIPNSVTEIGNGAFQYCRGLTSVSIPNSITSIEYDTFQYCTGLTSVTIPNSVTEIGEKAFYSCTNLKSLTLGSALRSIYVSAFRNCPNISTIVIRAVHPPRFIDPWTYHYDNFFDQSVYNNAYLYVPEESVSRYKGTSWDNYWSKFLHVVGKSNLGIEDASADYETFSIEDGRLNCGGVYTEVYTLTGAKVYGGDGEVELPAGAYIVEANGRATKVYIK